ncbi:hypothetical protein OS189_17900 [Sulfitobacter sp. F26169L]|uniref:hypothetical protein n=1 Tax=Sulfitobacter sp. F26169L TaxID=2996015 RepID=UPI002260D037|nr:hypothetical protein [Sulfitobacter sp. F26169L]MCX7568219.1 hypothetical protein [Sulfitobacter sp. F26169L]
MTEASNNAPDNAVEGDLDASSLEAIRSILTEDVAPPPPARSADLNAQEDEKQYNKSRTVGRLRRKADALPRLAKPAPDPEAAARAAELLAPKPKKRKFSLRRKNVKVQPVAQPTEPVQERSTQASLQDRVMVAVRGYRPKPAHIALGGFALLVLLRPWLVLGLVFLMLFIVVGVFLILGYDGFWQRVMKFGRWYANRRPARAAVLHARLDRFAVGWDAVLDRFPEGTVDGLYLPDFGELATADQRHGEAMERRLAGMQEKGT